MDNTDIITQLQEFGPLPDDRTSAIDSYPLQEFDALLQQLTEPLEPRHSLALINLGPPRDASTFEVEWSLIHAAENISADELQKILPYADNTEVKRIIEIRLNNYYNSPK
ncbi:hypothetical protein GCM10022409_04130 [Hymenobacter glaciei]|uniref:Uncharacterized protein n=1 Tax=Hymenobacter glaciei TaxID=877209 RepID=A0ABP7TAF6_9BACT